MPSKVRFGTLSLWFLGIQEPALERTSFEYDPELGEIIAVRGRVHGAHYSANCFLWTPAVRALAVLIIRTASSREECPPALAGEYGSLASSLDYAISKNPDWISDMFGTRDDGAPHSRALLQRSNPQRKRPGPVLITVNNRILPSSRIKIFLDNVQVVHREDLISLADRIEGVPTTDPPKPANEISDKRQVQPAPITPAVSAPNSPPTPICHFFLSSLDLDREYLRCLRRRVIDRKFAFLGMGAGKAWADVISSPSYRYFGESLRLVEQVSPRIAEIAGVDARVVAIWPGSGDKESLLARAFNGGTKPDLFLVDSSQEMLTLASDKARQNGQTVECYLADFMQAGVLASVCDRVRISGKPNVLSLFGHTLGSFPQSEILQTVRAALRAEDYVIFGIHCRAEGQQMTEEKLRESFVSQYDNVYFESQLLRALEPAGIRAGMGRIELEALNDKFFPDLMVVEHYFRFSESYVIRFAGEELPFAQGERILTGSYYQYTQSMAERILLSQGFRVISAFNSRSGALEILCQRH